MRVRPRPAWLEQSSLRCGDPTHAVLDGHDAAVLPSFTRSSENHPKQGRVGIHPLNPRRRRIDPRKQIGQRRRVAQLQADERRARLAVGTLRVLEQRDVVVRPEHPVEKTPQLPGFLRKFDDEVMLAALEHERTLDDLRITRHVVVSARQDREDELAIGEVDTGQR